MLFISTCAVCNSMKPRFIKNLEVSGLLSNLEIESPLSKIPLLDNTLF